MLINLKEILVIAEKNNYAIGAFNTPNLESIMAVIHAAERYNVPVVIMHAEIHEGIMPLDIIGPIMVDMARKSSVPVCVHLDHGENLDYLKNSLDLGFSSVMYDGSALSYADNVANTCKVVKMAQQYSASVEAEIGILKGREGGSEGVVGSPALYTDPVMAGQFARDTDIDALACSFGTAHGFYKSAPKLDFERIKAIRSLTNLPLVMHGGSGVVTSDYVKSIDIGIRKINYYSYMSLAGVEGINKLLVSSEVRFFHDLSVAATNSMMTDVQKALKIFYRL